MLRLTIRSQTPEAAVLEVHGFCVWEVSKVALLDYGLSHEER
jgi:hypothetical protein